MDADMIEDFDAEKKDVEQTSDESFDSAQILKSAGNDKKEQDPNSEDRDFENPVEAACDIPDEDAFSKDAAAAKPESGASIAETDLTEDGPVTLEAAIEAILFASDESISSARLAKIAETTASQVRRCVESLNKRYKAAGSAFRIEQIAGGYQMLTLAPFDRWLKKLITVRGMSKLSNAALETLAIISYKQPIIRADIEAIRGVQCGEVIRSLMYKGLVKIAGRAEILGRPMQYGTTRKFLEVFGLNSLKDLPKVEELKKPEQ
jgi:segregation and condensation protein B